MKEFIQRAKWAWRVLCGSLKAMEKYGLTPIKFEHHYNPPPDKILKVELFQHPLGLPHEAQVQVKVLVNGEQVCVKEGIRMDYMDDMLFLESMGKHVWRALIDGSDIRRSLEPQFKVHYAKAVLSRVGK